MSAAGRYEPLIMEYIAYRRSLGFKVTDGKDAGVLISFGRYADRTGHAGPVTTSMAVEWAKSTPGHVPMRWARRLDFVRGFARYRSMFEPGTEIPPPGLLGPSRYHRKSPHIYSDREIADVIHASSGIRPAGGLRPKTYATLFALLACTGMRVSEALALDDGDVNLETGVLTVRWSKFGRSRLVPLHRSSVDALLEYRAFRDGCLSGTRPGAFLVNEDGRRMLYHQARMAFKRIRLKLAWAATGRAPRPRIHDLRHTFAVRCIQRCYAEGANVDQRVAALATYLGHVNVTKTYWYLTAVPELMALVGDRFERFAQHRGGEC